MATPTEGMELPPGSYDDISAPLVGLNIAMMVVVPLTIVLRFSSRLISKSSLGHFRSLWWDDWTALIASLVMVVQLIMTFLLIDLGAGRHVWVIPPDDLLGFLRVLFAGNFVFDIHLATAKASALFFLSRIFPAQASPRWFNNAIIVTHGLNIAWFVGIVLATFLQCDPVARNWEPMLPGTCSDISTLYLGSVIPSIVVDFAILLLPMPKLWSLKMAPARKMTVIGIFALGYCAIIVSLGRLITAILLGDSLNQDPTYDAMPIFYWFTLETPVILLSISIPAMLSLGRLLGASYFKPLASKISSEWWTRSSQSRGGFRSKTGDFTGQSDSSRTPHTTPSTSKQGRNSQFNTAASNESQSRIYMPPQPSGGYSVEVTGWEMQDQPPRGEGQGGAISVRQDVEVKASQW